MELEAKPGLPDVSLDSVAETLASEGKLAAVDRLCQELQAAEEYHSLFYARLMRKRVELGVSPFPTGPAQDLPAATHAAYEDAIREAAREIGGILIAKRDLPRAWGYYRLIGEVEPIKQALETYTPGPDDDTYPIIDIAWHQQINPQKGFDILLDRHGVCSAITMVGGADLTNYPDIRIHCVSKLLQALHEQLTERLRNDLQARGMPAQEGESIASMVAGRDELFGDDTYHIDVSHLSAVVQMSLQLPAGTPALSLAKDLCEYGRRLAPLFQQDGDPPFEKSYADYLIYLQVLSGEKVEEGLAHFRKQAEEHAANGSTFPAEIYVNLLTKIERWADALDAARTWLANEPEGNLSCPGITELARKLENFTILTEIARQRGDAVTYLASLMSQQKMDSPTSTP